MSKGYDNQDYTKYIVDVPNYDKDGNDVTHDYPVEGGRRRKDGTLETSTRNYVPLRDHDERIRQEARREFEMEQYLYANDSEPEPHKTEEGLTMADYEAIGEGIGTIAYYAGLGIKKLVHFIRKKIQDDRELTALAKERIARQKEIEKNQLQTTVEEKKKKISKEEAERLFWGMMKSYVEFRRQYEELSNSEYIDQEKLYMFIGGMERLIKDNPELLENKSRNEILNQINNLPDKDENERLLNALGINQN